MVFLYCAVIVGTLLGFVNYLYIGARLAKVCEELYPKVNRCEQLAGWERVCACFLMPVTFFKDTVNHWGTKNPELTSWDFWYVSRAGYYRGVCLFWLPILGVKFALAILGLIIKFPTALVVLHLGRMLDGFINFSTIGRKKAVPQSEPVIPVEIQKPLLTLAQELAEIEERLATDGKRAAKLRQQLAKQGATDGYRGTPVTALAERDREAEREAQSEEDDRAPNVAVHGITTGT